MFRSLVFCIEENIIYHNIKKVDKIIKMRKKTKCIYRKQHIDIESGRHVKKIIYVHNIRMNMACTKRLTITRTRIFFLYCQILAYFIWSIILYNYKSQPLKGRIRTF